MTAVPFVGKDSPSPTAEFAHPDVLILLTFLAYRYDGMRESDTTLLVGSLKDELLKQGGAPLSRPTALMFQKWLADGSAKTGEMNVTLPLSMIDMGDSWQAIAVHETLRRNRKCLEHYCAEIVLPNCLQHHESRLGATGEELGDSVVFGQRLAYTGTPNALLPRGMGECCYEELADGRMLDTLSSSEHVTVEWVTGKCDALSLLSSIATHDPPLCALIDPGAFIVGLTNKQVAQTLLDRGLAAAGMRGVVFLDAKDHRKILLLDGRVVPLEEAGMAPKLRFTFYDQLHTMGMDIAQPWAGRAAVLIGKDMRLRDYTQACWRMRGIGAGQVIQAMLMDEVARLVARVASTTNAAADLLAWLTLNEIRSERVQAARLAFLHARTEERRPAFEFLFQQKAATAMHVQPYLTDVQAPHSSSTLASREMDAEVEVEQEVEVESEVYRRVDRGDFWKPYEFEE